MNGWDAWVAGAVVSLVWGAGWSAFRLAVEGRRGHR